MNYENYQVLAAREKDEKSNEELNLENVKNLEMQERKNFINEREDSSIPGNIKRLKNFEEKDETSKLLIGKTNIIVSRAESLGLHKPGIRNQIQLENKLSEKNDDNDEANEEIKKKKGAMMKKRIIYIMDYLVTAIIIGPLVISHWRGIWVLMDFHENIFTGWQCFAVGMSFHLLFAVFKHPLDQFFATDIKSKNPSIQIGCRLVRALYTYAFSFACNCHWRGAWILLNDLFGDQAGVITCFTLAILGDLIVLRCVRNLLAPPFLVTLDSPKFVFQFPTRYKVVSIY